MRILLLTFLILSACTVDEPTGKSDFYIYNLSSSDLLLEAGYQGGILAVEAPAGQLTAIGRFFGDIGEHAYPSEELSKIEIFLVSDPSTPVYTQNPVDDDLWDFRTPEGYEFWEYAYYTLIITDSDIQ